MSSIPSAPAYGQILVQPLSAQDASISRSDTYRAPRRIPSMSQGQALEKLGRALSTSMIRVSTRAPANSRRPIWKLCRS